MHSADATGAGVSVHVAKRGCEEEGDARFACPAEETEELSFVHSFTCDGLTGDDVLQVSALPRTLVGGITGEIGRAYRVVWEEAVRH